VRLKRDEESLRRKGAACRGKRGRYLRRMVRIVIENLHAARLSDKQVLVAPTTSQQAGLAAAIALVPERTVEENARALTETLTRVRTGAVAPAARDDAQGRFRRGEAVGFVEEEMIAWGEARETLRAVLEALAREEPDRARAELISVLGGEDAPLGLSEVDGILDGGVELELRQGDQPAYWWLITAE